MYEYGFIGVTVARRKMHASPYSYTYSYTPISPPPRLFLVIVILLVIVIEKGRASGPSRAAPASAHQGRFALPPTTQALRHFGEKEFFNHGFTRMNADEGLKSNHEWTPSDTNGEIVAAVGDRGRCWWEV